MPPIAAGVDFLEEPIASFGLFLMGGALVAGLARRSFLSLTAVFFVAGFLLGQVSALAGTQRVDLAGKAFMSWFGPKGVATMTAAA